MPNSTIIEQPRDRMVQDVFARPDEAIEALLAVQHGREAEIEFDG